MSQGAMNQGALGRERSGPAAFRNVDFHGAAEALRALARVAIARALFGPAAARAEAGPTRADAAALARLLRPASTDRQRYGDVELQLRRRFRFGAAPKLSGPVRLAAPLATGASDASSGRDGPPSARGGLDWFDRMAERALLAPRHQLWIQQRLLDDASRLGALLHPASVAAEAAAAPAAQLLVIAADAGALGLGRRARLIRRLRGAMTARRDLAAKLRGDFWSLWLIHRASERRVAARLGVGEALDGSAGRALRRTALSHWIWTERRRRRRLPPGAWNIEAALAQEAATRVKDLFEDGVRFKLTLAREAVGRARGA